MSAQTCRTSRHNENGDASANVFADRLAERLGRHRFQMWFGHARFTVSETVVEIITDRAFVARWIEGKLSSELHSTARDVVGEEAEVKVTVETTEDAESEPEPLETAGANGNVDQARSPVRHDGTVGRIGPRRTLRRLDDFVVGPSNRLAYSTACQLAENDEGSPISPLFIHGECGVGKTHLLQGICDSFATRSGRPGSVRYVTGEQFTNDFIAAVRSSKLESFRRKHRKLDLLAIDDVHFVANKQKTQQEILHTLDTIGLTGARIVLASDDHPRHIKRFNRALVSRFMSGMVVQIERPDRETRITLVRRLASTRGLTLSDQAVQELTARCVGSVRELEGAVTKLAAMQSILIGEGGESQTIGMTLVERLFQERTWRPAAPVRIDRVIDVVCTRLGISRCDVLGNGRHRRVVLARGLVAFLGRDLTTQSFPEIAEAIGRTYHSTVHTAAKRLRRQLEHNELVAIGPDEPPIALRELVDQLRHAVVRGR